MYKEEEYEHELELQRQRIFTKELLLTVEKRVSKLEEVVENELMRGDVEAELIKSLNEANEIIVKIKTWLQGTIDAGAYGGDKEETDRADGAMDLCRDLLEEIEEWENE